MAYDTGLVRLATSIADRFSPDTAFEVMEDATHIEPAAGSTQSRSQLDALRSELDPEIRARSLEMAQVVAQLGLGDSLCTTAALAPAVHSGTLSLKQIAKRFPADVAASCRELKALLELSLPGQWTPGDRLPESQGEALRRMLLAVVNDYRIVIVRLAVQLVDLRHARHASKQIQAMLGRDTREIFAPLANRLGIWQLKWELEDFAFRYLQPDDYRSIAKELDERRDERMAYIESARAQIITLLDEAGIEASVTGRPKHIYSIYRKLQRKKVSLGSLYDVRAVRILVESLTDCYTALGLVHNRWPYIREEFDDYIANPKGNNYRSLHTAVFGPDGHPLEIQIRTHAMHNEAELGVAAHWRYKEGGPSNAAFEQKIAWLRQLLDTDTASANEDLLDSLSEGVFSDRVYAITPRGDIIDLPAGATPLDFAYQVHTQVGHRCKGARINDRIVTLTHRINNGDRVEIITSKEPQPSRDWLSPRAGFLASARNRAKVRSWFRQQDRDVNRRQGREHLDRELNRVGIRDLPMAQLADKLKFDDVDELCVALGAGDITTAAVFNAAQQLLQPASASDDTNESGKKRSRKHKATGGGAVLVDGADSVLTHFAKCCHPMPPEHIAGYITQGRGITVHRVSCGSFKRLLEIHPERVLRVDWRTDDNARFPATLAIEAGDRNGLLKDISGVLADEGIRILANNSRVDPRTLRATVRIETEVEGLSVLSKAIGKLSQRPGVDVVYRV
ncbi:MAG: bifunctional (p)ppGpp synthetase/guanosine-3',5'-bis(diphosphate) 3'-pyrophosphohydrolase [Pseudomonadota bacterium]